ncbi:NAD(P)/FAD-dependent oxidoreductase [Mumia quercus]|uniref:NAD(P)/FAD-dependent oxidoreductase n=1 Tax=Mumia quercus TaxID=2976125 RepID=UPI0021CEC0C0|nr:FAD-dependent oxidoreductase [Mumia quercus]
MTRWSVDALGTASPSSSGPGVVIVGASLSGLRAARSLREHGYHGPLRLIGDEADRPYDRPPLSKKVFSAPVLDDTSFELADHQAFPATWQLGVAAVRLDAQERHLTLSDGSVVDFETVVIATGARPRRLDTDPSMPEGVLTLRTRSDAVRLRSLMAPKRRLVIVGGGFIGSELASAAAEAGHDTTLVMRDAHALAPYGEAVGSLVSAMHHDAGVRVHSNRHVTGVTRGPSGTVSGLRTSRGWVPADVVVVAIGATPNTEWLAESGLVLDPGIRVDAQGRALGHDGRHLPHVLAVGDVASRPHPLVGDGSVSLPHWSNAVETGTAAGRLLATGRWSAASLPSFWSDIHGARIRSIGLPQLAHTHTVTERDPDKRRLVVEYRRGHSLVGALTVNRTSRLAALHQLVDHDLTTGQHLHEEIPDAHAGPTVHSPHRPHQGPEG